MLDFCLDFFNSINWHCLAEPADRVRVTGIEGTQNAILLKNTMGI